MTAPTASLSGEDGAELGEFLGFLHDWITEEHDPLAASMRRFSLGLIDLEEIRYDMSRFAWALGAEVSIVENIDNDDEDLW